MLSLEIIMNLSHVRLSIRLAFLFACLIFGLTACRDTGQSSKVATQRQILDTPFSAQTHDWPQSTSDLSPPSNVTYGRLKNGLRYAILPEADETGVVSIQLNISAGANDETEDTYGTAHLLEHIAFRGRRGDGDTSIIHGLQTEGVGFGSDFNGFTSSENTAYYVNLTKPSAKQITKTLADFREITDVSALSEDNLAIEKKIVLAELNRQNTVKNKAAQSYIAFRNPQNPRAKEPVIGTQESLTAITLEHVIDFKTKHYTPDSAFLVIVGDVDLKKTRNAIQARFSDWEQSSENTSELDKSTFRRNKTPYTDLPHHSPFIDPKLHTVLRAAEHMPSTLGNDVFSQRRETFINRRVIAALTLRLKKRAEGEPKVSWITPFKTQSKAHDLRGVRLGATDYEIAYRIFEEERRRLIKYGLTEEEYAFALKNSRAGYGRAAKSSESIGAWKEAAKLRKEFVEGRVYLNAQQELELFERFDTSLSKADIDAAAKTMWIDFDPKFSSKSTRSLDKTVERIQAEAMAMTNEAIKPPLENTGAAFKKAVFSDIGKIISRDFLEAEKTHRLLFDNGTRLNFKQSKKQDNEIFITLLLKPNDDAFLQYYSAIQEKLPSISWGDIAGMTSDDMERAFVGKRARFNMALNGDRFWIGASTTQKDLKDSLELVSTFLVNFDLTSEDHARSYKNLLKRSKNSQRGSAILSGTLKIASFYSDRPQALRAETKNDYVIHSKRDELIKNVIKTGAIEVGVIGDFDEAALTKSFTETIGAIPDRDPVQSGHRYTLPKITHQSPDVNSLSYLGTEDQMALFYCWPLPSDMSSEKSAEYWVLSDILKNRLHAHIREELGLTYNVQKMWHDNEILPNLKFVCFSVQIDPNNEELTLSAFGNVLEGFETTPIKKSEFNRALNPILSQTDRFNTKEYYELFNISRAYSDLKAWRNYETYQDALKNLRLKAIQGRAQKMFKFGDQSIFRVQKFQARHIRRKATLLAKSHLGDTSAQFELGRELLGGAYLGSRSDAEKAKGLALLEKAGAQGEVKAYLKLADYYFLEDDLKRSASYLEEAKDTAEGAYRLSSLYFNNFAEFPDVPDAKIIELAKYSAENNSADGQLFYAGRLKDGTLTQRDEIGALKWALIGNYNRRGELELLADGHHERFQTGLTDAQIAEAQKQASDWVKAQNDED